jgi:hypothetical protein
VAKALASICKGEDLSANTSESENATSRPLTRSAKANAKTGRASFLEIL